MASTHRGRSRRRSARGRYRAYQARLTRTPREPELSGNQLPERLFPKNE